MNQKDFIKAGQAIHNHYGLVAIVSKFENSRTLLNIRCIQRGKGWNESKQRYEIYRLPTTIDEDGHRTIRRRFTNGDDYNKEDITHINELKPINK